VGQVQGSDALLRNARRDSSNRLGSLCEHLRGTRAAGGDSRGLRAQALGVREGMLGSLSKAIVMGLLYLIRLQA